jgi:hypothetical protein
MRSYGCRRAGGCSGGAASTAGIKQSTYDNEYSTKNVQVMHNRIMLSLKLILNQTTMEADMKDC